MNNKEEILSAVEKMTVLELSELVKALEEKFGVSAVPITIPLSGPMAAGVMPGAAAGDEEAEKKEEKTSFVVELINAGSQKIQVIKALREITTLGLKEAKDLTDAAPKAVKEGVNKEEAEEIKKKLEAAGATVVIK